MGVSKTGDPHLARVTGSRPGRKGERKVQLTPEEASALMTLNGADHLAHRRSLHAKYKRMVA